MGDDPLINDAGISLAAINLLADGGIQLGNLGFGPGDDEKGIGIVLPVAIKGHFKDGVDASRTAPS
jgi:hypothetical protein